MAAAASSGINGSGTAGQPPFGPYTYNVPLTGFSITVANGIRRLILEPAGTLAAGTVTMPPAPSDGDEVGVSSTQAITTLTVSANAGQTMADTITTFAAGGRATWKWVASTAKWYLVA